MPVLIAQVAGVVVFWLLTLLLGFRLRGRPEAGLAERLSRVSHLAFWLGLVAPWAVGVVWPGPAALDRLTGLPSLPLPLWLRLVLGAVLLLPGMTFMQLSMRGLGRQGRGAPAFKLTQSVVRSGVYGTSRNPMSFGYYASTLGASIALGSTWMLLYTLFGVVLAHVFNLKFFEELELKLRYGSSYESYRTSTSFLLPRFRSARPTS